MNQPQLILSLPHGNVTATSLGISGLAQARSPGSGKHFRGRSILVDLACDGDRPEFTYLNEGGWRDPFSDSVAALAGVRAGSRTKTALSNMAFSCIPIGSYRSCHLVKTGGECLPLAPPREIARFAGHACHDHMNGDEIAEVIGQPPQRQRTPRLYMVIRPTQFLILSNLTPAEYAWYATHRPGKIFRQVMFAEIGQEQPQLAALSRYEDARRQLTEQPDKKTKSIVFEDCLNQIPYRQWRGYRQQADGGLYVGDRDRLLCYPFPAEIPHSWDKVEG